MTLQTLFFPHGVALYGSVSIGKIGFELIQQMIQGGFAPEKMICVNPKGNACGLVKGFTRASDAGITLDLAVIAAPAHTILSVLDDASAAGISAAVLITSGFSEAGNRTEEEEIVQKAHEKGIRLLGPNCAGMCNTANGLSPTLEILPDPGGLGIISQSGAVGGLLTAWAKSNGLGVSKFVSYGNAADITPHELIEALAEDEQTKVIALYIESLKNGKATMQSIRNAVQKKPVFVIKPGRTEIGKRAAASHTGSLAGEDLVYDTAIRQSGAVRVRSLHELQIATRGLLTCKYPLQGNRCLILTNSGGPGVLAGDAAADYGLQCPLPDHAQIEALRKFLPSFAGLRNPIDLTVGASPADYQKSLDTLLPHYDCAIVLNIFPAYGDTTSFANALLNPIRAHQKPVFAVFGPTPVTDPACEILTSNGIACFEQAEDAVFALAKQWEVKSLHKKMAQSDSDSIEIVQKSTLHRLTQLLEPKAMTLLKENGLPVLPFVFAQNKAEAVHAVEEIGYPVVMKVVSPQIIHKTEFGGVLLNLKTAEAVRHGFEQLSSVAADKDFQGVVIYPMLAKCQEVLIGLTTDQQFGPVIVFGLGGIFTEVLKDFSMRIAPVTKSEALEMITEIKGIKLLTGFRGEKPVDLQKLAQVISSFSKLPFIYPEIQEADLNPVFCNGDQIAIGDVRILLKEV